MVDLTLPPPLPLGIHHLTPGASRMGPTKEHTEEPWGGPWGEHGEMYDKSIYFDWRLPVDVNNGR